MKKQFLSILSSLAFFMVILTGCKKEDNPAPATKTKTQLISQSPWIFQSAFAGSSDVSNAPQLACFKDNIITFAANGTGTINEGSYICSPSTAGNFTWSFQTNETMLVLSAPLFQGGGGTFSLGSLTETNIVVSQDVNFPPPTTVTFTFKH